ncbi:MAG: hypothetical protein R2778_11235 [Saprospiraceae bacterium]
MKEKALKIKSKYINKFIERLHEIFKDLDFHTGLWDDQNPSTPFGERSTPKTFLSRTLRSLCGARDHECAEELEKRRAWDVYSYITRSFQPITERLRDWITSPKSNGYESLQTTIASSA